MEIVNYEDIIIHAGATIDYAVQVLEECRNKGELVRITFNGIKLHSDEIFTVDEGYLKVLGMTKEEHENRVERYIDESRKRRQEHKNNIPALTKYYEQRGREILPESKWKDWNQIVPIRLGDLYQGMELGNCLDIVKLLNEGGTLDEAREEIYSQGHSGMSFSLVCYMVEEFADGDRGKVFRKYVLESE